MTVRIGEKIKGLRKKANVTQEKFAEYLGVSPQAVSKWEVEGCYPDLELLAPMASFFNITIDELMDFDSIKNKEKIKEICNQVQLNFAKGLYGENIEILRTAVNEFPNDYDLLTNLARALLVEEDIAEEERKKNRREAISICTRILEDCADDRLRFRALHDLAFTYHLIGEKEKAIETANKLPDMGDARDLSLTSILDGEEKHKLIMEVTANCANIIWSEFYILGNSKYAGDDISNVKKRIELWKKLLSIETEINKLRFKDENYIYEYLEFRNGYNLLWSDYIKLKDYENALDCIEKYAEYCTKIGTPGGLTYASVIYESEPNPKSINDDVKIRIYEKAVATLKDIPAPLCEHARFKAVIAELEKYAKKKATN
jgi:transcriptional regulator with XRE-family HTH domain